MCMRKMCILLLFHGSANISLNQRVCVQSGGGGGPLSLSSGCCHNVFAIYIYCVLKGSA